MSKTNSHARSFTGGGMAVVTSTPQQFAEFLKRENVKYTRIIDTAGISAEQ